MANKDIYWVSASTIEAEDHRHLFPGARLTVCGLDFSWAFAIFEPIPGFPGYWVGSDGTIWRYCRGSKKKGRKPSRWSRLNLCPNAHGYSRMSLCKDGKKYELKLHRVVLEVFVGMPGPNMEGCHINGNRMDGGLANLRWGTRVENAADKQRHGTLPFGSSVKTAKLSEEDVKAIKRLLEFQVSHQMIARKFSVSRATIYMIDKGETWKHVERSSLPTAAM